MNKMEITTEEKLVSFRKMVTDLEQETLWKIKDYENLLESRVNEGFVTSLVTN
jgi:hypothetical protein